MGLGGTITLVNGTTYDWNIAYQHSYQLNNWSFPATIPAGTSARVYVEWNEAVFANSSDDAGEAGYTIGDTGQAFKVMARSTPSPDLAIAFDSLSTPTIPAGTTIDLGWIHNGDVHFVLSGVAGRFLAEGPGMTSFDYAFPWMSRYLDLIGNRTLRSLCVPGSHDAGTAEDNGSTAFANPLNTGAQTRTIALQLQYGSRYLDIRPVLIGGTYSTGHYSYVGLAGWQGATGESIDSVLQSVNDYVAANREVVILNLSHDLMQLPGGGYKTFGQDEWDTLFEKIASTSPHLFKIDPANLLSASINDMVGPYTGAVIVIFQPMDTTITLGNYRGQGFYTGTDYPLNGGYSDTNDLGQMVADQWSRLRQYRHTPNDEPFLLSWTLTQGNVQSVTSLAGLSDDIIALALQADPVLAQQLLDNCTPEVYPNILYLDNFSSFEYAALAMAVNLKAAVS